MARPVVFCACVQISTTSRGMMYHSGSFGIRLCSTGLSLRPGVSRYLPTKSECSITVLAFLITAGPVFAKIVNSPAVTLVGVKKPESSCPSDTRIRFPDLSTVILICAGQVSSLILRYALSQRIAMLLVAFSMSGYPAMN